MYSHPAPPQSYIWIPDSLVRKIRTTSLVVGAVTTLVSFVVGIVAVWTMGNLPVSDHPLASLSPSIVAISAFFAALSGVAMMLGRSYIVSSHLDVSATRRACRLALVIWIAAILLALLAGFNLMMIVGAWYTGDSIAAEIVMFMLLPAVLVVVTGILFFVARWLLRPSPSLLRQHYASAQA